MTLSVALEWIMLTTMAMESGQEIDWIYVAQSARCIATLRHTNDAGRPHISVRTNETFGVNRDVSALYVFRCLIRALRCNYCNPYSCDFRLYTIRRGRIEGFPLKMTKFNFVYLDLFRNDNEIKIAHK